MENLISEELLRIQKLMGIKNNLINEQGPIAVDLGIMNRDYGYSGPRDEYGNPVESVDPEDVRYETWSLGQPNLNPDIPGFNVPLTLIMGPKEGGPPKTWKFTSGTKIEDVLPDNMKIYRGDIKDADGVVHTDQPYILGKDNVTKFCLPTNDWLEKYASLGLTYMFENPKTKKRYALLMGTWGGTRTFGPHNAQMTGVEASKSCYGADNGWEFKVTNVKGTGDRSLPPYKEVGGGTYWDPSNISMFDPRSENDIWWDRYGVAIEIVVGVGIALAAPYIATALLAMAPELGAVGALITKLNTVSYGASNMLIVLVEVFGEGTLLMPRIGNQLSRGDDLSAGLTALFCFLPFLMELKTAQSWLKNGITGKFTSADVNELTAEVAKVGGWKTIFETWNDTQRKLWTQTLSPKNQETMSACMQLVKNVGDQGAEGSAAYAKFVAQTIEENSAVIQKNINQKGFSETDKAVSDLVEAWASPTAVLTGKGVLPSLTRGFIMVVPIAIGLQKLGSDIKELYPNETELWQKEQENRIKKLYNELGGENGFQLKNMAELYDILGWTNKPDVSQITRETYLNLLKDPKFKELGDEEMKDRLKTLSDKKVDELVIEKNNEMITGIIEQKDNINKFLFLCLLLDKRKELTDLLVEKMGYGKPVWESSYMDFTTPWNFTVGNKKGQIVFSSPDAENGTYKIMIEDNEVFPNKKVTYTQGDKTWWNK
jgi:hypothetical protein